MLVEVSVDDLDGAGADTSLVPVLPLDHEVTALRVRTRHVTLDDPAPAADVDTDVCTGREAPADYASGVTVTEHSTLLLGVFRSIEGAMERVLHFDHFA
jgi:hypothetical protein